MYPPDLTAAQRRTYVDALLSPGQEVAVRVQVFDRDLRFLRELSPQAVRGGQVDGRRNADVEVTCTLDLEDDGDSLLDIDLRHLVRVEYGIRAEALGGWVWTPVITGIPNAASDDGDSIKLTLHDKAAIGLLAGHPTRTYGKGRYAASAIRAAFESAGETRFRISPGLTRGKAPRLRRSFSSGGADAEKAPTKVARRIANAHGLQVYYDPMGFLVVAREPRSPVWTWREDDGAVTSRIGFNRDLAAVRNIVVARGKKGIRVTARADAKHINHPSRVGRRVHYLRAPSVARKSDLRRRAERVLSRMLLETTEARFTSVPLPFLAGPWVKVRAERIDGRVGSFWLNEFTLPLGAGDMTIGYRANYRALRGRG